MFQKKLLLLIFSFFLILGCREIQKYIPKFPEIKNKLNNKLSSRKLIIGIDKNYYSFFECRLKLEIIKSFFDKYKYKNIQYIKLSRDKLVKKIRDRSVKIALFDETKYADAGFNNAYKSLPLFLHAVYFLIHPEEALLFKNTDYIYKRNSGLIYQSDVDRFIKSNYKITNNFHYYSDHETLIEDFMNSKIKLLLIDRSAYYKNILRLPVAVLNSIEYGSPYESVYFNDLQVKEQFDNFLNSKTGRNRYDWSDLVYKKPKKSRIFFNIEKIFKNVMKKINLKI